jgi:hypothetical protein
MTNHDDPQPLETLCLIDGLWGIYVPQRFADDYTPAEWNYSADDAAILLAGPDHESYWEAWDDVTRDAYHLDKKGRRWTLSQDGDLFAERWED